ncbi:MAG TPA: NAD(P)/FAD-dependent oxidoreductase [Ramlibacter sp.]|nr:NAD(P)/FAD-dependent oxidoreductase [Ramlibacter sp.]
MSLPYPRMRVAVVGAGFAGLAAACMLARSGHRVSLYDKFDKPESVGAGILIQPSGLAAMRVLGIDEAVLQSGARIDHLWGVNRFEWPVVNIRYDRWQAGSFGIGLHRGVLFDALWHSARDSGVKIFTGHEVRELAEMQGGHDLVVIADGCRSSLRVQTGLACSDRLYPWGAVWAVLKDPERHYGSTLWQWYRGAREMLGIMPTGLSPDDGEPVVSLFWSLRADRHDAWREAGLESFKRGVLALNPRCAPLLDQLKSMDDLTWARYHDVEMPVYHTDRCVVIGDAAHATSPQLGQGTNLALLDAVVLADCLDRSLPLSQALERYTQVRRGHAQFYGQASRWLTPLFQSDLWLLPLLRDLFMNAGSALPVFGALARQTLVGVRQRWLSGKALELALPNKGMRTSAEPIAPCSAGPEAARDAAVY